MTTKGKDATTDGDSKKDGSGSSDEDLDEGEISIKEYNYLVTMPMVSMTLEKVEKLTSEVEAKKIEI